LPARSRNVRVDSCAPRTSAGANRLGRTLLAVKRPRGTPLATTGLAVVALVLACPAARAGTYEVRACDAASGANNSWAPEATMDDGDTETFSVCPSATPDPLGDVAQGLGVQDVLQGEDVVSD